MLKVIYLSGFCAVVKLVQQWLSPDRRAKFLVVIQSAMLDVSGGLQSKQALIPLNYCLDCRVDLASKRKGKQAKSKVFFCMGCYQVWLRFRWVIPLQMIQSLESFLIPRPELQAVVS